MEVTGYDYVIYSTKSIFSLEEEIKNEISQKVWTEPIVSDIEREQGENLWLFFAKDQEMEVDDIGYTLDKNGEGCFSIIGRKYEGEDMIMTPLNINRKATHEVRLILSNVWEYTLVLPEYIESSPFAKKVYQCLIDVLHNEDLNTNKEMPVHKPVQDY